ncbi:MAG: endonuclease MutS2 [Candidatus Limnocylindrales bacterium]
MIAEKTLQTLEFTTVRTLLAERTSFTPGRELALTVSPETTLAAAERLQEETAAARELMRAAPSTGLRGAHDVRQTVRRAVLGGVLDPGQLLAIGETVRASATLFADVHPYPPLAARAAFARPPGTLAAAIEQAIGGAGEVLDRASPALSGARSELRTAQSRLQQRLDGLLRSGDLTRYLQESIVTQRGGRYVVPVKSEHRSAVKGIVHDQSASGATVFIEPLEILEANNRVREAELAEQTEVQRILDGLSRGVERAGDELGAMTTALAALDLILARAALADAFGAERPRLNAQGIVDLIGARHPLLLDRGGPVVPIDVRLGTDFRVLVITGPNTGGKTVTLKTIGLLILMAAAGMQVPAERGSALPVVPRIFADIGDEQSIAQSLSTFSSHLRNVVATLAGAEEGDLALLDEVGAGTDPDEGAALAMAVLETLLERGVLVAASTHYPELKAFALNTPGVTNASVEFDLETLRPTYRVHVGLPGASNAFAIASRLGLGAEVLAIAERHLGDLHRSLERTLRVAERQRTALAASLEEARVAGAEAAASAAAVEREADGVRRQATDVLRRARVEAEELILQARRALRQAEGAQERGARRNLVEDARAAITEAEEARDAAAPPAPVRSLRPIGIGEAVHIEGVTAPGILLSIDEKGIAEVSAGQLRMRVPRDSLRAAPTGEAPAPIRAARSVIGASAAAVPLQLDLRGARAEEALEVLDRYLNDVALAGHDRVRIVHGKGTGALRNAVREVLARHPLVHGHTAAGATEGGDGATIVTL